MGSYFVNPALLWGGLAIAAPILIFLLTRFRYRTVEWAALVFLERALKRQQRRLRLENILLLLIRCLLLLLFAVALARPRAKERVETKEDVRRNIVIALDTSWSMGYQLGSDDEETAYERARRAARELVAGLEAGDRVLLFGFDETARSIYATPKVMDEAGKGEVLQDFEDVLELKRTERGTDLPEALAGLPRLLERFDFGPDGLPPPEGTKPLKKTLFLLTDAQRKGILDASGALLSPPMHRAAKEMEQLGTSLVLVDCGADEPRNVSVITLAPLEPVVGQDLPCHIECTIKNWSTHDQNDLTVEFFVDGATTPQKSESLSIPAGEERATDPLRYVFKTSGSHRIEVQVKSDALTLDNRRHVVVDVRKGVRVLLVDGEPSRTRWESETDFVKEALALSEASGDDGLGLIRPEVVDEPALSSRTLSEYDVVALCNVAAPGEETIAALEAYARAGGAVVFTVGAQTDAQAWTDQVWRQGAGLLPCALRGVRGGTYQDAQQDRDAPAWSIALSIPTHTAVAPFQSEEMLSHLKRPTIYGFMLGETAEQGQAEPPGVVVPLRAIPRTEGTAANGGGAPSPPGAGADPGLPLLVEKSFGRGRAVVWLSTVDYAWNTGVLEDGFYVPFWRQLVLDLAQRSRPVANLPIGGRYERLLRPEEYAAKVDVETPEGRHETYTLEKLADQDLWRLVYPPEREAAPDDGTQLPAGERDGVEMSGLYTITRQGGANDASSEPEYFAVAIDPSEGDLARYSADELQVALEVPVKPVRHELAREALQSEGGPSGAPEFWRAVIAAVLLLLVVESALAAAFGRRRR